MSDQPIALRGGTATDTEAIAHLHATSWQESYQGLMPDTYLAGPVIKDRQELWRLRLASPPQNAVLIIAEVRDTFAGFIYLYPDTLGSMILDNLHVDAGFRGHGVGEHLMRSAAAQIADLGYAQVLLYVLDGNDGACRFYERLGGIAGPVEGQTIAGFENIPSIPYRWHNFSKLAT